jgi:hypothetical protein
MSSSKVPITFVIALKTPSMFRRCLSFLINLSFHFQILRSNWNAFYLTRFQFRVYFCFSFFAFSCFVCIVLNSARAAVRNLSELTAFIAFRAFSSFRAAFRLIIAHATNIASQRFVCFIRFLFSYYPFWFQFSFCMRVGL